MVEPLVWPFFFTFLIIIHIERQTCDIIKIESFCAKLWPLMINEQCIKNIKVYLTWRNTEICQIFDSLFLLESSQYGCVQWVHRAHKTNRLQSIPTLFWKTTTWSPAHSIQITMDWLELYQTQYMQLEKNSLLNAVQVYIVTVYIECSNVHCGAACVHYTRV